MRIAMFSDCYSQPTGVSTHVVQLADELVRKGCDVTVFTGSGSSEKHCVVNLAHVPFPLNPAFEVIVKPPLRVKADVVHVHTPYATGLAGMIQHKPRVVTTHTLAQNIFPGALSLLQPLAWAYLVSFYNAADRVICQTQRTKQLFESHGLARPVSVISAGVDTHFMRRASAARFRKKYGMRSKFVLSTSRLSAEKRPWLALQACRELGLKLVLTSDGPLRKKLEAEYPEAVFLGFVPRENLRDAYKAAHVLVLCSAQNTEGEGLGVLEAMSVRTPVIASDAHHVADNFNGYSFSSYTELKQKLERLWADKKLQTVFAKRGVRTAKECDIRSVADKMLEVYDKVL